MNVCVCIVIQKTDTSLCENNNFLFSLEKSKGKFLLVFSIIISFFFLFKFVMLFFYNRLLSLTHAFYSFSFFIYRRVIIKVHCWLRDNIYTHNGQCHCIFISNVHKKKVRLVCSFDEVNIQKDRIDTHTKAPCTTELRPKTKTAHSSVLIRRRERES